MIDLDPYICGQIREARRKSGISQSELSREVGCKQSALSMFEQGDGRKLNDEVIKRLCDKFGIDLKSPAKVEAGEISAVREAHTAFCPNAHCPSHSKYSVDGVIYLEPDRVRQDPVGGRFCAVCGEVLESKCPNCGAPVHSGAVCSICGERYVAV